MRLLAGGGRDLPDNILHGVADMNQGNVGSGEPDREPTKREKRH